MGTKYRFTRQRWFRRHLPAPPCVMLGFPPQADRPSLLVYFQQWYQKGFLVKPKRGHSNNTQGQWWEPASLPVIIHLFTELMTVAGGRELGASSHVMSPTHAKGLGGQAGDKKCGLYKKKTTTFTAPSPNLLCLLLELWQIHVDVAVWQVADVNETDMNTCKY